MIGPLRKSRDISRARVPAWGRNGFPAKHPHFLNWKASPDQQDLILEGDGFGIELYQ